MAKEKKELKSKEQDKVRNNEHYILVKSPREYLIDSGLAEDEVEDLLVEEGYDDIF